MYKDAVAVAFPSERNPFEALAASVSNMGGLLLDFMYGTRERCSMTFYFALGLTALGFIMESSQAVASMQNCTVTPH